MFFHLAHVSLFPHFGNLHVCFFVLVRAATLPGLVEWPNVVGIL